MLKKVFFILMVSQLYRGVLYANATGEVLKDTAKGAVVGGAAQLTTTAAGKAAVEKVSAGSSGKIANFFENPQGIALMSGIATIYSKTLYDAAEQQEEDAKKNIVKIEKIIKSYSDSWQNHCPNGREKLEEPSCYCYLESGKENPQRTNSQICITLWAKNKYFLDGAAGTYANSVFNNDPIGCVAVNGQFDENCKCKKMLNSKGQNACQKDVSVSLPMGISSAVLGNTGLKETLKFAANTFSGNPNLNSLSGSDLKAKAIAGNRFNQSLLSQVSKNFKSPMPEMPTEENVNKFAKAILGEKAYNSAVSNSRNSLASITTASLDPKANQLIQDLKKSNSLDFEGTGGGLNAKKNNSKKNGLDFNFSEGGAGGNSSGQVVDNFPEKEYKFKNSDVSTDKSASIFEIISNRYIQSGLKRLFED